MRTRHRRCTAPGLTLMLAVVAFLAGCDEGLSGRYVEQNRTGSLEFRDDGTVYVELLGLTFAGEYTVDGDRVVIKGPHGSRVYTINDNRIEGDLGLVFLKEDE